MDFQYNEDQQQLADAVQRLAARHYSFEQRQKIVDSEPGHSPQAWAELAELGLLGLPFAEADGGFAGGAMDLMATMETMGQSLMLEPYLATVALGGRLVAACGSAAQRAGILPALISGRTRLALAHGELGARYQLSHVETQARRAGEGWRLDGRKSMVQHAGLADRLVVSACIAGAAGDVQGIGLFLVDPAAEGVRLKTLRTIDGQRAADIELDGVVLGADAVLGEAGQALPHIEEAVDLACVLLCAEAVGAMAYANAATLEYLKTRRQFGVPIGSFQALQHRMVEMNISATQARSITLLAASRFDAATRGEITLRERQRLVSAAKVRVADAVRHVGQEAVQMHGGMGITREMKVAHSFMRMTMIAQTFGDADHHLARFAALS